MHCAEFQELYSEYRDGRLHDLPLLREVERHLGECPRCARQDLAVRRGVELLRSMPGLEPTPAFRRQLHRRLELARAGDGVFAPGGLVASLLVAAAVALVLVEGVTRSREGRHIAPAPRVVANPGPPFVGFAQAVQPEPAVADTLQEVDPALIPAVAP